MKLFALIATSLALLTAGVTAQEAAPAIPQIKVTVDSVVTNYPMPPRDEKLVTSCSGQAIFNDNGREVKLSSKVSIKYGDSFKISADKATLIRAKGQVNYYITLQSDGKIESAKGEDKMTQFVASGTQIEIPENK